MFVPSITPAAEPALNRVRQRVSVFSSQAEPLLVEGCPAPHGGDPPVRDRFSWAVMSTQHVDVFASAVEATSHPVSLIVLTFPADSNTQAVRPASLHRWTNPPAGRRLRVLRVDRHPRTTIWPAHARARRPPSM